MNKKLLLPALIIFLLLSTIADAQVIMRRRPPGRMSPRQQERIRERLPKFEPTVNLTIGYGVPNLDKEFLPEYYDLYHTSATQKGPFTASLDYQFSRRMSIGLMVTHGTVSTPYYDYYNPSDEPVFLAKYENWSLLLNLVRYIPAGKKVSPYLKTAIGINLWEQQYTDADHNDLAVGEVSLPDLAYQAAIGVRFNLSAKAGLFVEAGYGKYVAQGGLAFKF